MVNQKSKGSGVMFKTSNQSCLTPLIDPIDLNARRLTGRYTTGEHDNNQRGQTPLILKISSSEGVNTSEGYKFPL